MTNNCLVVGKISKFLDGKADFWNKATDTILVPYSSYLIYHLKYLVALIPRMSGVCVNYPQREHLSYLGAARSRVWTEVKVRNVYAITKL